MVFISNHWIVRFPAPREVWVGSYSLGAGGKIMRNTKFPSPLEAWGVSYNRKVRVQINSNGFPSPLEVWVGSYMKKN